MDFTGRPLRGFLYVDRVGLASAPALRKVDRAGPDVRRRAGAEGVAEAAQHEPGAV